MCQRYQVKGKTQRVCIEIVVDVELVVGVEIVVDVA